MLKGTGKWIAAAVLLCTVSSLSTAAGAKDVTVSIGGTVYEFDKKSSYEYSAEDAQESSAESIVGGSRFPEMLRNQKHLQK